MASKQVSPITAVTKVMQHDAKLLRKVNARVGNASNEAIATAYFNALQSPDRVKAFLSGLVDEKLLVS